MARLRAREPDLGGDLGGDGPEPLLRELAWVFGIVFDGHRFCGVVMVVVLVVMWLRTVGV